MFKPIFLKIEGYLEDSSKTEIAYVNVSNIILVSSCGFIASNELGTKTSMFFGDGTASSWYFLKESVEDLMARIEQALDVGMGVGEREQ
jgi:hypothetical protein